MGGCQNSDPLLDTLNIRCRIIIGNQKGTALLTTTLVPVDSALVWCTEVRVEPWANSRWALGSAGMVRFGVQG